MANIQAIYALSQYVRTLSLLRADALAAISDWTMPIMSRELFVGPAGSDVAEMWLRVRVWYGYAYVVLEGWKELGLTDPQVDAAIVALRQSNRWEMLRRFRNANFHLQNDPTTDKFSDLLTTGQGIGAIQQLDRAQLALDQYFAEWRNRTDLTTADHW